MRGNEKGQDGRTCIHACTQRNISCISCNVNSFSIIVIFFVCDHFLLGWGGASPPQLPTAAMAATHPQESYGIKRKSILRAAGSTCPERGRQKKAGNHPPPSLSLHDRQDSSKIETINKYLYINICMHMKTSCHTFPTPQFVLLLLMQTPNLLPTMCIVSPTWDLTW